ncbi:MAG TPA: hypothetical protein VI854_05620, partial [Acidimicrobiia bacterium]|nr:hypothetical protein [Acidimicrobiia bacterium]
MPEPSLDVRPTPPTSSARLSDWLARLRAGDDPVAGVALVVVVAVVAGLFWYRAGLGGGAPSMAGAAPRPEAAPVPSAATTTTRA